ncbi:MAG: cytochrome c oxidase assembly protein [Anaerolineaceae bacterium]|nr:cytochrome c oxidase assembly protein [Anaerolineaceae bacterium]
MSIVLVTALGLYCIAMSRAADQVPPARQRQHLAIFFLGLLVTLAVFIPAPDLFGPDYRFTVSMAQMLLAVDGGPLLIYGGLPTAMLQPFMKWKSLGRGLARPHLVGAASMVLLLAWFLPALFQAASSNLSIWVLKQILFLLSGLLFWWPVAAPLPTWRPAYPAQLVYLLIMRIPMTLLGVWIGFANSLIYSPRASFALEICAPSSLSDQQAGGLVMWTVGGLVLLGALAVVFFRWSGALEAARRRGT